MLKRFFDFSVSLIVLILLSPIILIVGILVRIQLGAPVIFSQERPGKGGEIFRMLKFRSMTMEVNSKGELLPDHMRLNRFGKLLRSSSLDELPGLWNVLKGDMSLVGPRPLRVEYLSLYSPEQARRHEVRPGITGWAQVNGRNAISWEERFKLDVWYVDNRSFWLDIKILLLTLKKVFKREGVSQDGHVTMPRFEGSTQKEKVE